METPLAERLRPQHFEEFLGQDTVVNQLKAWLASNFLPHLMFYGPPGTGKTTLCRLLCHCQQLRFIELNATSVSVKTLREVRDASVHLKEEGQESAVFLDEVHRLSKNQQEVLLPYLEQRDFLLLSSTTDNPMFALTPAMRSRITLLELKAHDETTASHLLQRATAAVSLELDEALASFLVRQYGADLRQLVQAVENLAALNRHTQPLTMNEVGPLLGQATGQWSVKDTHYDLASAFQKSLRGSDLRASMYYLAKLLESGEDPRFIARRLWVTAAEDVGNAAPMASMLAFQAMQAVKELGLPEARIHLSQTVQFIATAPKSNAAIERVEQALSYVRQHPSQPIPSHLRDSHYQGAKDLHGGGYQNPHRHAGHQTYLPEGAQGNFPSWSSRGHRVREEEKDLEALKTSLLAMLRRGSWQDFDPKEAAVRLEAPEEKIKQALNGLIQEGVLKFRRLIAYDLE